MQTRRGLRFALEAAYLAALAAALAFSSLATGPIVAVMLAGWVLVAAAEWLATRREPHFAAGLPPRWAVPAFALPPAQPLEQVLPAYPEAQRDEAPTWIASAALREELLGGWPVAVPADDPEDTQEASPDPWLLESGELPPLPNAEPAPAALAVLTEPASAEPEPEPDAQPAPEPRPDPPDPRPEPPVEAVAVSGAAVRTTHEGVQVRRALYHVDPLAEPGRRRFGRRVELPALQVPERPVGLRPLPGGAAEESPP
jgi:hypothetical protein